MDQIVHDVKRITSDVNGFSIPITFSTKDGVSTATVRGIHSKHHLSVDAETGQYVESRKAHVTVAEGILNDAGYVTRDSGNNCILKDHRVTFTDVYTKATSRYAIERVFPDDTTGLIVCILGSIV